MPFIDKSTLTYPATNAFPGRIWLDQHRSPTSGDFKNFQISDTWIYENNSAWIMIGRTANSGQWVEAATTFIGISSLTGNSGGAVGSDGSGNINIIGGTNVTVTGVMATHTLTITLNGTVADSFLTDDSNSAVPSAGVLTVHGTGGITTSSSGSTVTITAGATIPTTFTEDSGSATPAANNLNINGGTGIATSGAGHTVTIAASGAVATSYVCDTGTAIPALNVLNVNGAGATSTTGSGHQILITTTGGGIPWSVITIVGPTSTVPDHGYITNNGSNPVQLLLPTTAAVGQEIQIVGMGAGGWQVNQNVGQQIFLISSSTTVGVGGFLNSSEPKSCITLRCIVTNTTWAVQTAEGNIIVT